MGSHPLGRNRRSVWTVATKPFDEAHFAVMPEALVEPCVLAGTSEKGCCPACGAPWGRVVERPDRPQVADSEIDRFGNGTAGTHRKVGGQYQKWLDENPARTVGWELACRCDAGDPVPCTVLDPFAGAGTTALVAAWLGRRFVGCELNPEYADMARRRVVSGLRPVSPLDPRPARKSLPGQRTFGF